MDKGKIRSLVDKAIHSLFQIILVVDRQGHKCQYIVDASYGYVLEPVTDDMTDLDEYTKVADEKMYQMKKIRDPYRRD